MRAKTVILTRSGMLPILLLAATIMVLFGCAETQLASHAMKSAAHAGRDQGGGVYKVGNPYKVAGVWYYPQVQPNYDETGIASWYGKKFHGKSTANGEIYDMNARTAAHKTLPMPVQVRVTNLENGRSLLLRVNDRGPFVHGRVIDVSRRGAQLLGFEKQGTARVRVQLVGSGRPRESFVSAKPVTRYEERLVSAAPTSAVSSQALTGSTQTAAALPAATGSGLPANVDLRPVPASTQIFVQAGSFQSQENAYRLQSRLAGMAGGASVTSAIVNGRKFYRVRVGPLPTVAAADAALEDVLSAGQSGARIVVD